MWAALLGVTARATVLTAFLSLAPACTLIFSEKDPASDGPDGGAEDTERDAAVDASDPAALPCEFSVYLADLCDIGAASEAPTFEARAYVLDTDTRMINSPLGGSMQIPLIHDQIGSTAVAIWYVEELAIPEETELRATGTRTLVVVSQNSIEVAGTLDVSSDGRGEGPPIRGAGSNGSCSADSGTPTAMTSGGGSGGGGGSFQGAGGQGGVGNDDGGVNQQPGAAGQQGQRVIPMEPMVGCDGGDGGFGLAPTPAAGGAAGGSLLLIGRVNVSTTESGRIDASGAGGDGGTHVVGEGESGGGGGGGGGFIGIEAPSGQLEGAVVANGGGGGGGGTNFGAGQPGRDGDATADTGTGGAPHDFATGGGNGGSVARASLDGATVTASTTAGGGGGGGGAGWIVLSENIAANGVTSPQPARL